VIKRSGSGYAVFSKKGKRLSKKGLSKKAARRRLAQIEYFKHKGRKG